MLKKNRKKENGQEEQDKSWDTIEEMNTHRHVPYFGEENQRRMSELGQIKLFP